MKKGVILSVLSLSLEKQIAVSTFNTSLYETKDGGNNWSEIITTGNSLPYDTVFN